MDVYDGTNQCTPSIGYLIFGVEDGFLLDGIYFFDNTCVRLYKLHRPFSHLVQSM